MLPEIVWCSPFILAGRVFPVLHILCAHAFHPPAPMDTAYHTHLILNLFLTYFRLTQAEKGLTGFGNPSGLQLGIQRLQHPPTQPRQIATAGAAVFTTRAPMKQSDAIGTPCLVFLANTPLA
jgi:hypothetical protein